MDIDTTAERIIPTANFVSVVHPYMPTGENIAQLDGSIEYRKSFEVQHEPVDLASKQPLEFIIHGSPNHFIDLQSFMIDVDLQITLANGQRDGGVVGNWKAHFINNLSQSLWSVIKVYLNDVCVESNYNNQQTSNLKHILTTPNTLIEERGIVQGIFPVKSNTLIDNITADHCAKDSIQARIDFARPGNVHVKGPLQLDLSSCEKYLVDGVTLKLVLEPAAVAYLIKSSPPNPPQAYDYKLKNVVLTCCKVKPSDPAIIATRKQIVKKPFEYLMRRMIVHREIIPQGYTQHVATRPFQNLIPNKLYIFLVDRDAAMGHQQRYPFYYDHCKLMHYSVKVNGFQIAGGQVDTDYRSEYLDSLQSHGGDYFIPFNNYANGCFVLCVNTNDQSEFNSINIEKSGNLSITLTFQDPLPRPQMLHIAGAINSPFTVDIDRTVNTEFQY